METQRSQADRYHRVIERKGQELNLGSLNPEPCPLLEFVYYILNFKKLCNETHVEKCTDHKYIVQYTIIGVIEPIELARDSWANSSLPSVIVNKVLLEYSNTHHLRPVSSCF